MAAAHDALVAEDLHSERVREEASRVAREDADAARLAAAAAQRDDDHTSDLLSALSVGPSRSPSSAGSPDVAREQQNLVAAAQVAGHTADAVAILAGHAARYPKIRQALLRKAQYTPPGSFADVPLSVLVPAVLACRIQEFGLALLGTALATMQSGAGEAGPTNASRFGTPATFDFYAADALDNGEIDMTAAIVDLALGVLPLTQLGLHFWYKHHTFIPGPASPLVDLATRLTFVKDGVLNPSAGLSTFMTAWADADSANEYSPHDTVYHLILEAMQRAVFAPGAAAAFVTTASGSLSWTDFVLERAAAWDDAGDEAGRTLGTRSSLNSLISAIVRYGAECQSHRFKPGVLRPPTSGGGAGGAHAYMAHPVVVPPPAAVPHAPSARGRRSGGRDSRRRRRPLGHRPRASGCR